MSSLPSWAVRGAKCVCVDATNVDGAAWFGDAPVVGAVYTIARAWVDEVDGDAMVELVELKRSHEATAFWRGDAGYRLRRFRPLITQADDIATHFVALLDTPAPVEPVEAA